jgi:hypothetical protein
MHGRHVARGRAGGVCEAAERDGQHEHGDGSGCSSLGMEPGNIPNARAARPYRAP